MSSALLPAPRRLFLSLQRNWSLWRTLVARDLAVRYRGTLLGRLWPVLLPLMMLGMYGFVFGAVFRARWPGLGEGDHLGFALNLFVGLLVHGMLAESVGQAPTLLQNNSGFVRKMVFPLPVLVAVPLGAALTHAGVGLALVFVVAGVFRDAWHASALAVPLVLLPYLAMLYGLSLLVAALGVYLRDLGQLISVLVFMVLFTAPVFYPSHLVPEAISGLVAYNPIAWPVGALRDALLHGQWPSLQGGLLYALASILVLWLGMGCFRLLRRGFADLL